MALSRQQIRKQARHDRKIKNRFLRGELAAGGLPSQFFVESEEPVSLLAAGSGEDTDGARSFTMIAYNGGKMSPRDFGFPVVVSLKGMKAQAGDRPIHFAHDQTRPVGHSEKISIDKSVRIEGKLSIDNEDSRMIIASADRGFPWKASVGLTFEKIQFFEAGESLQANGKTFRGPCYYVPKSTLFESSFVTVAGDNSSSTRIAASMADNQGEKNPMFEKWLLACGIDKNDLDEQGLKTLKAAYDAHQTAQNVTPAVVPPVVTAPTGGELVASAATELQQLLASTRAEMAGEVRRSAGISKICAQYGNPDVEIEGVKLNLQAHALEQGWSQEATELQALRASRAAAPAIHTRSSEDITSDVLEAACRLSLGQDGNTLQAEYGDKAMDVAERFRGISLRELAAASCQAEGVSIPAIWGNGQQTLKAAFTTQTLPNVMENVMNKTLLPLYDAMESIAKQICRVGSVNDFKQTSRVRLLGSGQWEKVAADGELKHGRISDEKYTNQAETYGQMLTITRQDWRNDDLSVLESLATYMAMMGNDVVEDEFFTLLLANTGSFVHANNSNIGAGVAFGAAGLGALKTLFRKQKKGPGTRSKNKTSVNVRPVTLLTSVEQEDEATSLIGSANLMMENRDTTATAGSKTAPKNPHFGRYNVLTAPQISDAVYTGNTSTGYWLFSDPRLLAAFSLVFLDGVSRPTIERIETPPNVLGLGFRGYIDFGVSQEDSQGIAQDAGV